MNVALLRTLRMLLCLWSFFMQTHVTLSEVEAEDVENEILENMQL